VRDAKLSSIGLPNPLFGFAKILFLFIRDLDQSMIKEKQANISIYGADDNGRHSVTI